MKNTKWLKELLQAFKHYNNTATLKQIYEYMHKFDFSEYDHINISFPSKYISIQIANFNGISPSLISINPLNLDKDYSNSNMLCCSNTSKQSYFL